MVTALLRTHAFTTVHAYEDDSARSALIAGLLDDPATCDDRELLEEFGRPWGADFAYQLGGDLVLLTDDGSAVAGGALRRYDSTTAQLGWVWTRPSCRRAGLATHVLAELEAAATWRGYERTYAVVGPGRGPARRLFAANGYVPVGRRISDDEYLGFVKTVGPAD
jgi:GNAT superfamily N-acetyltransferase